MSLGPVINGSETTCLTARKRLSAKDLQIDLDDELDIGLTAKRSSLETDEIFLTTEETSPAVIEETFQFTEESRGDLSLTSGTTSPDIEETFQNTGDTSPPTGDLSPATGETSLDIGETFQNTGETSPATGGLLLTARETSPAVGEAVPAPPSDDGSESTSGKTADPASTPCSVLLVHPASESSESVLATTATIDCDSGTGNKSPTEAPGIRVEPVNLLLPPDEIALLAKLEEANRLVMIMMTMLTDLLFLL